MLRAKTTNPLGIRLKSSRSQMTMIFADNWARVFVVITFLGFGEAQIIGGIVPNLIAFGLFVGAIGYFALTGKMAEMFGLKKPSK